MMIVALGVLCAGVAGGLLCHVLLQRKQQQNQRSKVKQRFFIQDTQKENAGRRIGLFSAPSKQRRLFVLGGIKEKRQLERSALRCEAELPRMLDILAMGMNAGLGFDAAFGLYVQRFDTELAQRCREHFEVWERGLISREEGLTRLSACIRNPLFDRFCRTAIRSLRHGVPMAPLIKEYAQQARREYRNKQKEKVLKAPVKMLLPTGVLILPAMMLLVIGPIILDVTERMV